MSGTRESWVDLDPWSEGGGAGSPRHPGLRQEGRQESKRGEKSAQAPGKFLYCTRRGYEMN